jgi:hypothetical protein
MEAQSVVTEEMLGWTVLLLLKSRNLTCTLDDPEFDIELIEGCGIVGDIFQQSTMMQIAGLAWVKNWLVTKTLDKNAVLS